MRRMARCSALAILLCLTMASIALPAAAGAQSTSAQAGDGSDEAINPDRPGIADGSRTIGAGRIQIEAGFQVERHNDAGVRSRDLFVPALLRVGIGGDWEFRIEGNTASWMTTDAAPGHVAEMGIAPISIGTKYTFFDSRSEDHRVSTGIIARIFPPSGSGDFHANQTSWDVRFVADWDVSKHWSVNPNLGFARDASSSGGTFGTALGALTLTFAPTDAWNAFVDVGMQSASDAGAPSSVILDTGIAWSVGRNVQLDVSLGEGAHGPAPRPFVAAGVSIRAGHPRARPDHRLRSRQARSHASADTLGNATMSEPSRFIGL